MKEISELKITNIVLEKIRWAYQQQVSGHFLRSLTMEERVDWCGRNFMMVAMAEFLGRAVKQETEIKHVPVSWWDHMMQDLFPGWLKQLVWKFMEVDARDDRVKTFYLTSGRNYGDPVRRECIVTSRRVYHLCPHQVNIVSTPDGVDNVHLVFLSRQQPDYECESQSLPPESDTT